MIVTKYNASEGIEILENRESGYIVYIQKDQVLEFEVNLQL